jgi:hypothetical protein
MVASVPEIMDTLLCNVSSPFCNAYGGYNVMCCYSCTCQPVAPSAKPLRITSCAKSYHVACIDPTAGSKSCHCTLLIAVIRQIWELFMSINSVRAIDHHVGLRNILCRSWCPHTELGALRGRYSVMRRRNVTDRFSFLSHKTAAPPVPSVGFKYFQSVKFKRSIKNNWKFRGLSPWANYTERETAARRLS